MSDPLSAERWSELGPLLDALLDAPVAGRTALLAELSGGDDARRAELTRLLAECEGAYALLDRPATERFDGLLTEAPARFPDALADRYRLARELGHGGMATVFLARDLRHDRDVAVKVMRPELSLGRERFLREIAIAAKLRHPNIVPLFDSGDAGGALYYVMPYEEGQSLRARVAREGPLALDDAVTMVCDICDALIYAHQQGIVHRDIKPDNVLLADRHAMLTDFGVARAISASSSRASYDTGAIAIGTPPYMAPEQVVADPAIDHRADIYALGVLAYELLAGRPPFTGDAQRVLSAHLTESPPVLSAVRADVPPALDATVMKCLAKRAADRWQSAGELRESLGGVLAVGTTVSVPHVGIAVSRGQTRRWLTWRTAIGVAAVAMAVAVGVWRAERTRAPTGDVEPAPLGIGILPVTAASPGGELDWLARGLEIQLSSELTDVAGLDIRPNETIAASVGVSLDSVARMRDVDYFVRAGLSRGSGDSAVVTLELIESGIRSVRAGRFSTPLTVTNAVQVVGRNAAEVLRPMLGARVRDRQLESGTSNRLALKHRRRADQYRLLARQRFVGGDPPGAQRALDSAVALLLEAQRLDPTWPAPRLARASLSGTRTLLQMRLGEPDFAAIRRTFDAGIAIVDSVLRTRPRDAIALAARGRLRWQRIGLGEPNPRLAAAATDTAQRDLEAALAIDTTLARAAADLSQLLFEQHGRFRDAAAYAQRAYQLDAFMEETSGIISRLAQSNLEIGDDAEAARWCAEGVRRFPTNPAHVSCFLDVMAWGNAPAHADSAWKYFRELQSNRGAWNASARATYEMTVAAILARAAGVSPDSARTVLARARVFAANDPGSSPALREELLAFEAAVWYRLGESARASRLFAQLQQADSLKAERYAQKRMLRGYVTRSGTPRT